jgi:glycosidase
MHKTYSIVLLVVLLLQSCSKSDSPAPDVDPGFEVPDTKDIVLYEINIGSFSNTHDLNGITNRLDHIQALGINTIWLMPIHPVGTVKAFGSPYCVQDHLAINPQLGGLIHLKKLVEEAHNRKIAVILDWVANHTAWDNPWITQHPNWYTKDGSGNIISPPGTNWSDVADLNFDNTDMRSEMISAMGYWIAVAGVDGFRCDAADLVPFDFWQQAIGTLKNKTGRDIILLAEGTRDNHFSAGFQMNFAWDYYNAVKNVFTSNGNPTLLYNTNTNEYKTVPTGKTKLRFTTNHDLSNERTPTGVFGSQQAALAASVATIFMNGTPLLYAGQEVGVSEPSIYTSGQPINWNANTDMLAEYTAMLQFYSTSDAARRGSLSSFNDADCIVFEKTLNDKKILVIINSRASGKNLSVPNSLQGNWENALTNQPVALTGNVQLNGHEYLILKN